MKTLESFNIQQMNISELKSINGGSILEINLGFGVDDFLFQGDIILSDQQILSLFLK